MKRQADFEEISDGKLYSANDMVKADSGNCEGCSACCHGMGNSIVLDPYDLYRITSGCKVDFNTLLNGYIELNMVDGVILPNLSLRGEEEACPFLNEAGRCQIHPVRPGICRLFPLGRIYKEEGKGFDYFLQVNECKKGNLLKVKVKKWIDTPNLKAYEQFIVDWHYFLEDQAAYVKSLHDEKEIKARIMLLLNLFYVKPYESDYDFYEQFYERLKMVTG